MKDILEFACDAWLTCIGLIFSFKTIAVHAGQVSCPEASVKSSMEGIQKFDSGGWQVHDGMLEDSAAWW